MQELINLLLEKHKQEYYCHIQFVLRVGLELAKQYDVDEKVIEISCLLHDIGRHQEINNEEHQEASFRIIKPLLETMNLTDLQKTKILKCVLNHNNKLSIEYEEEKIMITADSASKIIYHEAFMLLFNKENYSKKRDLGMKFLEKGWKNTLYSNLKEEIKNKYEEIKKMYLDVN